MHNVLMSVSHTILNDPFGIQSLNGCWWITGKARSTQYGCNRARQNRRSKGSSRPPSPGILFILIFVPGSRLERPFIFFGWIWVWYFDRIVVFKVESQDSVLR